MLLRALLALLGVVFLAFGLNVGAGGIATLGWLVDPGYVSVADPVEFAIQDSHIRFMGGLFATVGLFYFWGAMRGPAAYPLLVILSGAVAAGGVFRLTGGLPPVVIPSFLAEVVLMPALAYWLWRASPETR